MEVSRQGTAVWVIEAERYSLLNLATDALLAGDVPTAQARLAEVEPLLDRSQYSRFRYLNRYQLLRAELALAQFDAQTAARWAEEACALATAKGVRKNVARSQMLLGRALLVLARPVEAVRATGASVLQVFSLAVLPQALPLMISYTLLDFESNIRSATILGIVGAGGIGFELQASFSQFKFNQVTTILIEIVLLVTIIDQLSAFVRRRLI